jgi:oxygen-independent coproporphyrinogen III oxidase
LILINAAALGCFKLDPMNTTLTLAERAVPRYTSYPTAPHFSSDVGAEIYAAWLAALPAQATLSLYLHVPYCSELCLY